MRNANKNRRSKTISMANANGKFDKWWNRQSAQFKGIKKIYLINTFVFKHILCPN